MSKILTLIGVLAASLATFSSAPANAEFIKHAGCQDQLAQSRSSDLETASRGFQQ